MKLRAYYAALKPERTYANVLTTGAGFLFACQWHVSWGICIATLAGTTAVVMSACAVNNVIDVDIDKRMPRARDRATATGQISIQGLLLLATVLGLVGFIVLYRYVNLTTTVLGIIGYIDYVAIYGWSKRHTPFSTLLGTVSGAIPFVAGTTAATGHLTGAGMLLGISMVFWQMSHFYAIAIFRRSDYEQARLPVWSVSHGIRNTQYWMLIFTAAYSLSVGYFTVATHLNLALTAVVLGVAIYWLTKGALLSRRTGPVRWAKMMFRTSLIVLLVFSAGIGLSPLL